MSQGTGSEVVLTSQLERLLAMLADFLAMQTEIVEQNRQLIEMLAETLGPDSDEPRYYLDGSRVRD